MNNQEMVALEIFKALLSVHSDNRINIETEEIMKEAITLSKQLCN